MKSLPETSKFRDYPSSYVYASTEAKAVNLYPLVTQLNRVCHSTRPISKVVSGNAYVFSESNVLWFSDTKGQSQLCVWKPTRPSVTRPSSVEL